MGGTELLHAKTAELALKVVTLCCALDVGICAKRQNPDLST